MNSGELKVDVPLAAVESDGEDDEQGSRNRRHRSASAARRSGSSAATSRSRTSSAAPPGSHTRLDPADAAAAAESVTGSLEDLVNSFDEKLTQCFKDYQEQVEKIAPVQVRTQEEIMNECQVWWTITGNFGNMAPIDWSKSTARAKQLQTLPLKQNTKQTRPQRSHLQQHKTMSSHHSSSHSPRGGGVNVGSGPEEDPEDTLEDEDDIVRSDLDMHSLILTSNPQDSSEPVKSADEVIKEIDEIIDAADVEEEEAEAAAAEAAAAADGATPGGPTGSYLPNMMPLMSSRRVLSQALRGRNLEELSLNELTQILSDIELLVRELSEELVADLGVRDELEYEKELKNTFVSLLLSIQSRRRAAGTEATSSSRSSRRSRDMTASSAAASGGQQQVPSQQYKYLTTVIPYQPEKGTPSLQGLQVLVKILKAINEDSPAVPALLTDYILKVLCPS